MPRAGGAGLCQPLGAACEVFDDVFLLVLSPIFTAAFMHKDEFSCLMDQVIVRENLPGNTAAEPKKKVQIMVCADFEDSSVPQEKVSATTTRMQELLRQLQLRLISPP